MTSHPDVVKVAFVPTVDDQIRATLEITRPGRRWRWWATLLLLMLAVNAAMAVRREGPAALIGSAGLTLVVVAAATVVLFRPAPLVRRALVRHAGKHPAAYAPVEYTFGADGLRIESKLGTTELPWSSFGVARETKDLFLLSFANGQQFFVPRRALREADEPRLRTLLQSQLGTRAQLIETNGR